MRKWIQGLLPLVLLGVLLAMFFTFGPLGVFRAAFPPVEELTIERAVLPGPDQIVLHVVNGGPSPVTVAQVLVDDALWQFRTEPENRTIGRLGRMKVYIPYPWVEGEAHEVTLLSSTGLTFSRGIEVATLSPSRDWTYFSTFSMLGIYAGVIPVFLGLLFYPFLRGLGSEWIHFFLSLTVGLLAFLAVDTIDEALKSAASVAEAFQGVALVATGILVTVLLLLFLSRNKPARTDKSTVEGRHWTALMIALGIGLHNLTEGLGIVAPVAQDSPSVGRLLKLGALAGVPTIVGTWIGGFSYSPILATLFLSIGAGAILQVIYELTQLFARRRESHALASAHNLAGFVLGMVIMYGTGLLVTG